VVAPTVSAITPSQGRTLGSTLVEITGTDFVPPTPRASFETPTGPFTRVFFDGVAAEEVAVISSTRILCLTPSTGGAPDDSVDVRVENFDPSGPTVEPTTVVDGFTYKRASIETRRDHATDSGVLIVHRTLLDELRRTVVSEVHHDKHPEYVDPLATSEESQAKTPSLKLRGPNVSEDRFYSTNGRLEKDLGTGVFETLDETVTVMLAYDYVGVGRTSGEAFNLWQALTTYLKRTPFLVVPRDGVDPSNGTVRIELAPVWEERADFKPTNREGVFQFNGALVLRGVPVASSKLGETFWVTDDLPTVDLRKIV